MSSMKRRLVTILSVALAAAPSLGPSPLRAQNVAARVAVPVIGQGSVAGAVSLSLSSARLGLAPTLSAPNSLVPTLLAPALIPSAILAAQPQAAAALSQPVGIAVIHAVPVAAVLPNKGSRTDEAAPTEPLAQALTAVRESLRLGRTETLFTGGATRGSGVVDLSGNSHAFSPDADLPAASLKVANPVRLTLAAADSKSSSGGEIGPGETTNTAAELAYINPALNLIESKIDGILKETDQPTPKDFVRSAREALARLQKDRSYIPLPAPSDWAFGTLTSVVGTVIRLYEAIAAHTSTMAEFSAAYEAYMSGIRSAITEGESQGRLYKIAMSTRIKTRDIISRINAGERVDPWAAPTGIDALDTKKVGLAARFIRIKPGKFQMGRQSDQAGRGADEALHTVRLTNAFDMQATPVTQLQYFLAMGKNPSHFKARENGEPDNFKVMNGQAMNANHPVENVSFFDSIEFANKLSTLQGLKPAYVIERNADGTVKSVKVNGANIYETEGYRLPTEAEWEYAARAGTPAALPYSFGYNDSNELDDHAWHVGNSGGRTHAVAGKKANPWGLYDIHGNVSEWVQDWYYLDYPGGTTINPEGLPAGTFRIFRGGSWGSHASRLTSAHREYQGPINHGNTLGFRLVRSRR